MNSERSSSPIPKEEDVTKDKAIGDHKPQTFERPEHPVTSPISGQDPSIDTPFPGQTGSETTLSTPPTTAKPHPHGDAINDDLKRTEEADTTELEPVMSPGAKIDDFDWEDLEQRYLKAMEERGIQEQILLQEFEKLTQVKPRWSIASSRSNQFIVFCCMGWYGVLT